jgi:hypothetical protein
MGKLAISLAALVLLGTGCAFAPKSETEIIGPKPDLDSCVKVYILGYPVIPTKLTKEERKDLIERDMWRRAGYRYNISIPREYLFPFEEFDEPGSVVPIPLITIDF